MEENNKATSRNGHELKDMYDPETNTLDIRSNGLYPSNVLSNLCSNGFRLDGMGCSSMEGFLQSLKRQATSDMQHERWQCKKDECNIMADRPNSMVERKGNRQTKPSIPRFDSSCLQGNVWTK